MMTPYDYGAIGDGRHDDGPALNKMFSVAAATSRADIDLTGTWYVGETVHARTTPMSRVVAGAFHVLDSADLDVVLLVAFGQGTQVHGAIGVYGRRSAHLTKRNAADGVHIHLANFCRFDGFDVSNVRRYAVRNTAEHGSNIIGANLGRIRARFCGAPGPLPGAPDYTRATSTATSVVRTGRAGSPQQRARIGLNADIPVLVGDFVSIGGKPSNGGQLCEVTDVEPGAIEVYPWPGTFQGGGPWEVDGVIGGAVKFAGGNTTQIVVEGILAQYCGHALQLASLYGCIATGVTAEVVGSALTLGARASASFGANVRGLHGERTLADILVAGLNIKRAAVISPSEDVVPGENGYHVMPRLNTGGPTAHAWPVHQFPPRREE